MVWDGVVVSLFYCFNINTPHSGLIAENSNSRFETLEPGISAGSSVGNDSKTPVDSACCIR
jgi:hypothetical protein